jgi:D-alanyl-lipoteichoic acid acyltransferase DltB (MBOAT superfamily)
VLFNSLEFLIFLPIVVIVYYLLPHRQQNAFLVLASCFFYASWDWRFLFPLLFSTTTDYLCAARMEASVERGEPVTARRKYLLISLVTNLGLLGFFKYFNFFVDSSLDLGALFGLHLPRPALRVILPIGISFYTFQALSYTIDVYRGKLHATRSFWDFFLAVLFFPHLVAGPIQRAANLIAQVVTPRKTTWTQVVDGLHLIVWGFFKKVVIADGLAPIVNDIFGGSGVTGGATLTVVYAFAFQIYCDFSGYTDIARGVAKLLGFEFMLNFNLPYFATNPSDFWQRWHISLSSWLRDYLYISLGGNRNGTLQTYRNLLLTMVLGGLWHGAAWNFVAWGFYHGLLLIGHRLAGPALERIARAARGMWQAPWFLLRVFVMFQLTCYGWLLFRARSFTQIAAMTTALVHPFVGLPTETLGRVAVLCAPLVVVQIIQYRSGRLEFLRLPWVPAAGKAAVYSVLLYCTIFHGAAPRAFVYFQF